jgi:enterochelin esterase-like enzyme
VLFLHGGGDDAASFDRHAVATDLDQAVRSNDMPRVVVVVPDGELGFWENWDDRTRFYQDWVIEELLPHVAARYHTLPCPDGCHVLGNSMGGAGTLRFALRRPDLFSSAGILSGPIFDTDTMVDFVEEPSIVHLFVPVHRIWGNGRQRTVIANDDPFVRWQSQADTGLDRIYVAWAAGDRDGIVDSSERLRDHLSEHDIEHAWEEFEGGHNWVSWRPVITRAIAYQVGVSAPARR